MRISNLAFGAIILLAAAPAFSGETGGGGTASVCRDSSGRVISAKLTDIYDGSLRYGLWVPDRPESVDQQVTDAIEKMRSIEPLAAGKIEDMVTDIRRRIDYLPAGVKMSVSNDLGDPVYYEEGCYLEQVAFYNDEGQVKVLSGVYQVGIYKAFRLLKGDNTSFEARRLNAFLLADGNHTKKIAGLVNGWPEWRQGGSAYAAVYVNAFSQNDTFHFKVHNPNNLQFETTFYCAEFRMEEGEESTGKEYKKTVKITNSETTVDLPRRECKAFVYDVLNLGLSWQTQVRVTAFLNDELIGDMAGGSYELFHLYTK